MATSDRIGVMSDGRLEGVGEPRTLYRRPSTRFVAAFLGESNLFEGEVVGVAEDGDRRHVTVAVEDHEFVVTAGRDAGETETVSGRATVEPRADGQGQRPARPVAVGDDVTVCVRPESLSPARTENAVEVAVEGTEFLGEAVRAWGAWNGRRVVVRLADPPGETLRVGFDPADAHLLTE